MKDSLENQGAAKDRISNRDMAEGLRKALGKNYARILQAAANEWERRFAGKDPSDSCISIRISGWSQGLIGRSASTPPALPAFTSQAA